MDKKTTQKKPQKTTEKEEKPMFTAYHSKKYGKKLPKAKIMVD